jgi:predicted MFS family arabinose efflux permease
MAGALGGGLCVLLLPLADIGQGGWRALFVIALVGLLPLRSIGRHLPESRRFRVPHADVAMAGHGNRLWLLAGSAFLLAIFFTPASQFTNEFLRDDRGFNGARIALFTVLTSIPGGIGIVVGGRLAERGRRGVGAVATVVGVGATVAMFVTRGWPLWAWSAFGSVIGSATIPALGVYGPELFPTSLRGKANAILGVAGRVGSVIGLVVVGLVSNAHGFGPALGIVAVGPAILAVLILVAYPETAHRVLEDLNPEDAADG